MSRQFVPGAILLSLLALPAHAGMANATMQVGFVLSESCTVSAAAAGAPSVACSHDSPWRLGRIDAAVQASAGKGAAWTVTF